MRTPALLLAALLLVPAPAGAADLAKVDRTIKKEPAYKGKPKYCLLVFGPEARTKVWLVLDGDTLYVDRNADGDLTEPGEKVRGKKVEGADEATYVFKAGDVRDGKRLHKALTVSVFDLAPLAGQDALVKTFLKKVLKPRGYRVAVEVEVPGRKGTGVGGRVQQETSYADVNGIFQFSSRAQDAPVVHFGGPLAVTLFGPQRLTAGRETDLVLGVGTPGVGPGTTAWMDYEGVIPEEARPRVEVAYPPRKPGESPVRERYELKERC